jgi:hypothetical protein
LLRVDYQVEAVFREAVAHLQESGGGFHQLVVSHIETVVVLDGSNESVIMLRSGNGTSRDMARDNALP